jgi:hypothetical protein
LSANKTASAERERKRCSRERLANALNAFGLFARAQQQLSLDKAIAMRML